MKSWQFPVPTSEDKAPKTIAETVAQTVGVAKATSPWFTVLSWGFWPEPILVLEASVNDGHF